MFFYYKKRKCEKILPQIVFCCNSHFQYVCFDFCFEGLFDETNQNIFEKDWIIYNLILIIYYGVPIFFHFDIFRKKLMKKSKYSQIG